MAPVYNPINPGYKWAQAFDLEEGWLLPGDQARMEFRQTPLSGNTLASISTETGEMWIEDDRIFAYLDDEVTASFSVEEVVTNIVILRDDEEIPLGQIFMVPIKWLPTRGLSSKQTAILNGQIRPIRVGFGNGIPIKVGIVQGVPGPKGVDGSRGGVFEFVQTSPSSVWTIAHNLDQKPSVTTLTVGGQAIEGEVLHLSRNVLTITFLLPVAGSAHLV